MTWHTFEHSSSDQYAKHLTHTRVIGQTAYLLHVQTPREPYYDAYYQLEACTASERWLLDSFTMDTHDGEHSDDNGFALAEAQTDLESEVNHILTMTDDELLAMRAFAERVYMEHKL